MDEFRLISIRGSRSRALWPYPFRTETELQRFVIRHAERLLGVRMLAREFAIDTNGGGRVDALGIDGHSTPVIFEFKRTATGQTICQGLYYLDWLDQHREVFAEIVLHRFGERTASKIRWQAARLICVAEEITDREEAVARRVGRSVELVQLRRYATGVVTIQTSRGQRAL